MWLRFNLKNYFGILILIFFIILDKDLIYGLKLFLLSKVM